MKKLVVQFLSMLGISCKPSDYAVAQGLRADELQRIEEDCRLEDGEFEFEAGELIVPHDLDYSKQICVLQHVEALGEYTGTRVGNEKYVPSHSANE